MSQIAKTGVITVTLPDGKRLEVPAQSTIREVALRIGPGLGKACLGGRIDDDPGIHDLRYRLDRDVRLRILTDKDPEGLEVIRHSTSHVMADAICRLWPDAKLTIGPATSDGFYYDIDLDTRLTPEDLPRIEAEMAKIIAADTAFERCAIERSDALDKFRQAGEKYKVELIEGFPPGDEITVYRHGGGAFEDLCRGPHVPSTGSIRAYKLLSLAGAYWRGDEKNKMLQRVYGTAFAKKEDLDAYLKRLEEAKARDHRKLGRELGLFFFNPIAPANPFFLPKGAIVYNRLQQHMRELYRAHGYQEVVTPQVFDVALFKRSGHWDHYQDAMYFTEKGEQLYGVKPMNCPGHTFVYAADKRSYRELPLRVADFGRLHRHELHGVTGGLTRVRSFSQDDAHVFLAPEQVRDEITGLLRMVRETYELFGFGAPKVFLSTRPASSMGTDEMWARAESALAAALAENGVAHTVNAGDGAFYGPKIDFVVKDAIEREWQLGTIQLDFQLPERFDLRYTSREGREERPVVIHRAILGSIERFIGILIEQCAGNFPFWLAPEQARVATISQAQTGWAEEVRRQLWQAGFRVEADVSDSKIGAKVRDARLQRIPYTLVVGDREVSERTASVRERPDKELGSLSVDAIKELFLDLERSKK
jgi:threonyl-tRNA synthetase